MMKKKRSQKKWLKNHHLKIDLKNPDYVKTMIE